MEFPVLGCILALPLLNPFNSDSFRTHSSAYNKCMLSQTPNKYFKTAQRHVAYRLPAQHCTRNFPIAHANTSRLQLETFFWREFIFVAYSALQIRIHMDINWQTGSQLASVQQHITLVDSGKHMWIHIARRRVLNGCFGNWRNRSDALVPST